MKYNAILFVSLGAVVFWHIHLTQAADDESGPQWSYIDTQDDGPENWAEIGYSNCSGDMQSPILLDTASLEPTDKIKMVTFQQYDKKIEGLRLENSGTAVLLKLPESMEDEDRPYVEDAGVDSKCYLKEFRFHFGENGRDGTEHNVTHETNSIYRGMEVQALHECPDEQDKGNTGLVALSIRVSNHPFDYEIDDDYEIILDNVHKILYAGTSTTLDDPVNLSNLYNTFLLGLFIRYTGSLTYPPCTQGVIWTVYPGHIWITFEQIQEIRKLYRTPEGDENPQKLYGNIRPVQETNDREVTYVQTYR